MPEHDDIRASEQIGAAIRAAASQVEAPAGLRERIAQDRGARSRRLPWPSMLAAGGLGAAAAALVVALVMVLAGGSPGAPSVADAAGAALRAPTLPAPGVDPADVRYTDASIAGVPFPNYADDSAWRAVGARVDALGSRASRTVRYEAGPSAVGYTIVDGAALPFPPGSSVVDAAGTPVWVARLDGALVVSWERDGHTCVLASRTATLPQLLRFVDGSDEA